MFKSTHLFLFLIRTPLDGTKSHHNLRHVRILGKRYGSRLIALPGGGRRSPGRSAALAGRLNDFPLLPLSIVGDLLSLSKA
jgi:hypothetical protein